MLQAEADGKLGARYAYLYSSVDALTLADVRLLLQQYKELVLQYEAVSMVGSLKSCNANGGLLLIVKAASLSVAICQGVLVPITTARSNI